jgi:hypothetical protein
MAFNLKEKKTPLRLERKRLACNEREARVRGIDLFKIESKHNI